MNTKVSVPFLSFTTLYSAAGHATQQVGKAWQGYVKQELGQAESSLKSLLQDILTVEVSDKVADGDPVMCISNSATIVCL